MALKEKCFTDNYRCMWSYIPSQAPWFHHRITDSAASVGVCGVKTWIFKPRNTLKFRSFTQHVSPWQTVMFIYFFYKKNPGGWERRTLSSHCSSNTSVNFSHLQSMRYTSFWKEGVGSWLNGVSLSLLWISFIMLGVL